MVATATTKESESELVARAQQALSQCNWEVGECAAIWTKRFARGRTDADFASLVGLSVDQVYQRRRVWETFADVREHYPALKWSHFYTALNWDDAAECLQWAQEIQSTVAEMKAWRRAQRGEDLTQSADEEPYSLLLGETAIVKAPFEGSPMGSRSSEGEGGRSSLSMEAPVLAGVARQSDEGDQYAPFRDGSATPPASRLPADREAPTPEQTIKRLTSALEKCDAMLTTTVSLAFSDLPAKVRQRFLQAIRNLNDKVRELE